MSVRPDSFRCRWTTTDNRCTKSYSLNSMNFQEKNRNDCRKYKPDATAKSIDQRPTPGSNDPSKFFQFTGGRSDAEPTATNGRRTAGVANGLFRLYTLHSDLQALRTMWSKFACGGASAAQYALGAGKAFHELYDYQVHRALPTAFETKRW